MHSEMYERIKLWYEKGLWTKDKVYAAVGKGLITAAEYEELTGEPYVPGQEEATIQDYEEALRILGVLK